MPILKSASSWLPRPASKVRQFAIFSITLICITLDLKGNSLFLSCNEKYIFNKTRSRGRTYILLRVYQSDQWIKSAGRKRGGTREEALERGQDSPCFLKVRQHRIKGRRQASNPMDKSGAPLTTVSVKRGNPMATDAGVEVSQQTLEG
jgi:hypothetical protein